MSTKRAGLALALIAIVGSIVYLQKAIPRLAPPGGNPALALPDTIASCSASMCTSTAPGSSGAPLFVPQPSSKYRTVRELVKPSGFVNTAPFMLKDIVGKKVILIDFWTYSCINCERTTPYLNAWYEKYKDQGLEIVGVHTPEFEFEKNYANVQTAVMRAHIKYPVVLDNDYGTWSAYGNRFWPRKYLVDINGNIVYDHIGEGAYDETERKIQELLNERIQAFGEKEKVAGGLAEPQEVIPVGEGEPISPETYFGAARNEYLGNGAKGITGIQTFSEAHFPKGSYYFNLAGEWDITSEYAENKSSNAKIVVKYRAKNVYLVARASQNVSLQILLDGQPPGNEAGGDVHNSLVSVKESRLYKLIEGSTYGEHVLEIIVSDPGLHAYTFTFG